MTNNHDPICIVAEKDCCPWIPEAPCNCQCNCDDIKNIRSQISLESLAIQKVRDLHIEGFKDVTGRAACKECNNYLPCPTIQALDEDWNPLEHPVPRPEEDIK